MAVVVLLLERGGSTAGAGGSIVAQFNFTLKVGGGSTWLLPVNYRRVYGSVFRAGGSTGSGTDGSTGACGGSTTVLLLRLHYLHLLGSSLVHLRHLLGDFHEVHT